MLLLSLPNGYWVLKGETGRRKQGPNLTTKLAQDFPNSKVHYLDIESGRLDDEEMKEMLES